MPSAALAHDQFGGPSGMGEVVGMHAAWLLDAGWDVTLVGDNVPDALRWRATVVEVRRPRPTTSLVEHLEWCRRAARVLKRLRRDVVHVHAPALASHADLFTTHYISRVGRRHGVVQGGPGLEGRLRALQGSVSDVVDHRLYGRTRHVPISFVSEFLRDQYVALYGEPQGGWILSPPAPPWRPVSDEDRRAAREHFGAGEGELAVGFVGGTLAPKGFGAVRGLASRPGIRLLFAGPGSHRVSVGGRRGLGFVDMERFLPACDVLVSPSAFDSAPVAVLQALSRGIPVATSPTTGWSPVIERHGAGSVWAPGEDLADAVWRAAAVGPEHCRAVVEELSAGRQRDRLLRVYETLLAARTTSRAGAVRAAPSG